MTRYNIVDGEEIRRYEEVEYNGTKIVSVYDSRGKNVYRQSTYVVNERTNRYELQYVDQWLVNESGEVIKDYKQISSPIAEIEMNPEYTRGRNHENNYFKQSGCLLTALAGVFDFYGGYKKVCVNGYNMIRGILWPQKKNKLKSYWKVLISRT